MKLTNMEAIQAQWALARLAGRDDIPIKASLDIALISNMVDVQIKAYKTVLGNLFKKYSIKSETKENGAVEFTCTAEGENEEGTKILRAEKLEAFREKLNDLLEANTGDLVFTKVKLPTKFDGKELCIKSEILKPLTEFVEVE